MKNAAPLILVIAAPLLAQAGDVLPADVAQFVQRRDLCDHFRGEEPFDAERRAFLAMRLREFCTGTDRQFEALRAKYQDNEDVMSKLNTYETKVESAQ
ncbi:MAG: hypothetical protein WCH44_12745 [Betaproteobacteria bacterium]